MWNGKPVEKWTLEEENHFLTLLIGKCWHDQRPFSYVCHKCSSSKPNINFYHDLSGFQTVKDFMESQMAEMWTKHLDHEQKRVAYRFGGLKDLLNSWLSLDNLITFLLDNQDEWGWIKRDDVKLTEGFKVETKHPALTWAESLK